jgi:hypothetical protein
MHLLRPIGCTKLKGMVRDALSLRPKVCYPSGKGEDAMIIVVEIASRAGTRACKEYDAPSYNAAVEALKRELRPYPAFRVTGIWNKDDQLVQRETAEEW